MKPAVIGAGCVQGTPGTGLRGRCRYLGQAASSLDPRQEITLLHP